MRSVSRVSAGSHARPLPAKAWRYSDSSYAWYVTIVLALVYAISFVDRQVINLLVGSIRQHYSLTDTSVSLLIGFALTSVYVLIAMPSGRWVDTGHRRNILIGCGIVWSCSTMAAGIAHSYNQMFISRMLVGAAESAVYPACTALVASYFSREKLTRAMSFLLVGPFFGGGLALIFGGMLIRALTNMGPINLPVVGVLVPWQMTFVLVGLGGLIPIILLLTVKEPPRLAVTSNPDVTAEKFTTREALRYIWERKRFYVCLILGISLHAVSIYAVPAWSPTLLIRKFHAPIAQVGIQYGSVALAGGILGMLSGPWVKGMFERRGYRSASVVGMVFGIVLCIPVVIALPMMPTYGLTLAALALLTFLYTSPLGLTTAALQEATPDGMRGVVGAFYFSIASIIGLGAAPTMVGMMTDYVFKNPLMVGWSITIVVSVAMALGCLLILYSRKGHQDALAERIEIERKVLAQA